MATNAQNEIERKLMKDTVDTLNGSLNVNLYNPKTGESIESALDDPHLGKLEVNVKKVKKLTKNFQKDLASISADLGKPSADLAVIYRRLDAISKKYFASLENSLFPSTGKKEAVKVALLEQEGEIQNLFSRLLARVEKSIDTAVSKAEENAKNYKVEPKKYPRLEAFVNSLKGFRDMVSGWRKRISEKIDQNFGAAAKRQKQMKRLEEDYEALDIPKGMKKGSTAEGYQPPVFDETAPGKVVPPSEARPQSQGFSKPPKPTEPRSTPVDERQPKGGMFNVFNQEQGKKKPKHTGDNYGRLPDDEPSRKGKGGPNSSSRG